MSSPSRRILVADGDEIVLALISHIVNRQGYSVDVASTAEEARMRLASQRYEAVLLDSNLSEALAASPELAARTILLSANSSDPELPVHSIIRKPIEFGLLIQTLADCVRESD